MILSDQSSIVTSALLCIAVWGVVLLRCRKRRETVGFPLAYLSLLLLIHLPGALAVPYHPVGFSGSQFVVEYTRDGMFITAISCVGFLAGFLLAEARSRDERVPVLAGEHAQLRKFARFCVIGGWAAFFLLAPLRQLPSLGAAIYFGSAIWMLGVMLGLHNALLTRNWGKLVFWSAALAVYPGFVMLFGGFLSFGTTAIMIVVCGLLVRWSRLRIIAPAMLIVAFLGLNLFVNYFLARDALRQVLWSDAGFAQRVDAVGAAAGDVHWFNGEDERQLEALTMRLNQSEFLGLAAHRLDQEQVESLAGQSIIEAALSIVPRAIWPGKPVSGGSGDLVVRFTGLDLDQDTSWGVGNVMEFYLNGGLPVVLVGFVTLGFFIRWLDVRCYRWLVSVEPKRAILYFLPCAALIQPAHSLSEMVGGAVAALVAGFAWLFIWDQYFRPRTWGW